jgi:hypothetical protein
MFIAQYDILMYAYVPKWLNQANLDVPLPLYLFLCGENIIKSTISAILKCKNTLLWTIVNMLYDRLLKLIPPV